MKFQASVPSSTFVSLSRACIVLFGLTALVRADSTILYPKNGTVWRVGYHHNVTWSATEIEGQVLNYTGSACMGTPVPPPTATVGSSALTSGNGSAITASGSITTGNSTSTLTSSTAATSSNFTTSAMSTTTATANVTSAPSNSSSSAAVSASTSSGNTTMIATSATTAMANSETCTASTIPKGSYGQNTSLPTMIELWRNNESTHVVLARSFFWETGRVEVQVPDVNDSADAQGSANYSVALYVGALGPFMSEQFVIQSAEDTVQNTTRRKRHGIVKRRKGWLV
ncbi:hypothetical protein OH77DRAFT_1592819 [Trametes cingulata]|nr:hypothetical protein OH77DRAFT_1592819 [Trametes cingulata]